MRSICFSSCFRSEVIKLFSVTPSTYKSPYSMLQCNSIAPHSTLVLGCTRMIHLGIQWTRIRCSRAYAQHQHGRLRGLFPTLPNLIFSCVSELLAQHKCKYSCASQILTQHKILITHVLRAPHSTQKINYPCALELLTQHKKSHQSCASRSTPNTNKHIYIINNWLTPNI